MMLIFYRHPCVATVFDYCFYCFPSVYFFIHNHSTDFRKIFRNCVFWCNLNQGCNTKTGLNKPVVLKLFRRYLVEIVN